VCDAPEKWSLKEVRFLYAKRAIYLNLLGGFSIIHITGWRDTQGWNKKNGRWQIIKLNRIKFWGRTVYYTRCFAGTLPQIRAAGTYKLFALQV
jgi:hypothetical protein